MGEELVNRKNRGNVAQNRGDGGRRHLPVQGSLIAIALVGLVWLARDWSLAALSWVDLLLISALAVLCLRPIFVWYTRGMHGLPIGEIFITMHLIYYVLPCLSGRQPWQQFPELLRLEVLLAVGLYLVSFLVAYRLFMARDRFHFSTNLFIRRQVGWGIIWTFFYFWIIWSLLLQSQRLPNIGSMFQVFRAIALATGTLSNVFLFFHLGQRRVTPTQKFMILAGFLLGMSLNIAGGLLNGPVQLLGAAVLAFTLGRKQVPVVTIVVSTLLLGFLQLGKADYRNAYWGQGENSSEVRVGLVEAYTSWFSASWNNIKPGKISQQDQQGLMERASLLGMLSVAMDESPARKPFLLGKTYAMLPELIVPRWFWPNKPRGTLPSETLGIYYDVQTEGNAEVTGVSFGPVAESWANFGWLGLAGSGAFFGLLYGFAALLTRSLVPSQIGWLWGSVFLVYSTNLELAVAEVVASLLTSLVVGAILLITISKSIGSDRPMRSRAAPKLSRFKPQGNRGLSPNNQPAK